MEKAAGDISLKESDLRAHIESLALKLECVDAARSCHLCHSIGELVLAACAGLEVVDNVKYIGGKENSAENREVGEFLALLRLFYHIGAEERSTF